MPDDFELLSEDPTLLDDDEAEPEGTEEEPAAVSRETEGGESDDTAEPWKAHLRPGETPEQAIARLAEEAEKQSGRATRHWQTEKDQRAELEQLRTEVGAARKLYEKWATAYEAQAAKDLEAELPDPELEPEKAVLAETRALREEIAAREAARKEGEKAAKDAEAQRRQEEALLAGDAESLGEVQRALGLVEGSEVDPEFETLYSATEVQRWNSIRAEYPDEPEEKLMQAMSALRTIDARKARARGISMTEQVKRDALALFGSIELARQYLDQQRAAAGLPPMTNGTGPPTGTPTAKEVSEQAKRAAKAAGMRRSAGGAGVKPPIDLTSFSKLPEEEQARLIEQSERGEEMEVELWNSLGDDHYGRA